MKKMLLYRNKYLGPEILGHLMVFEEDANGGSRLIFEAKTLELEWKDNARNISCLPAGFYEIKYEYSNKFEMNLWEIYGVPNRSEAKIHKANYYTELQGCIAIGSQHKNLNGDGLPDLSRSAEKLASFHEAMEGDTLSTIRIIGTN